MKKGKDFIGVGVGAVIINESNEILLLKRVKEPESGYWTIPGGTVEFGEKIEETIVREIEEEIGVKSAIIKLLGVTNHILPEEHTHWVAPAFLVKIIEGTPRNMEPHSHSEMKWFSIDKLPHNPTMTTSVALENYKIFLSEHNANNK